MQLLSRRNQLIHNHLLYYGTYVGWERSTFGAEDFYSADSRDAFHKI
jgi:hypothetical protein